MRMRVRRVLGAAGAIALLLGGGCVTPSGQRIPGAGRDAEATTEIVLACENIAVVPEEFRESGWIFVDDAYYGQTSRPRYRRLLGNALVIGSVHVEKNQTHRVKVIFKGYEPVVIERYFGNLTEYVVPFRVQPLQPKPVAATGA